jgi:hypothetical protein
LLLVSQVIEGKAERNGIIAQLRFLYLTLPICAGFLSQDTKQRGKTKKSSKSNSPWQVQGESVAKKRQRAPTQLALNAPWRVEGEKSRHGG